LLPRNFDRIRSAASLEEYIIDEENDPHGSENGEPMEGHAFDAFGRRCASGKTVTAPMIGDAESVTARHTRFERHPEGRYSR
jgi:hypothetical protein